MFVDAGGTATEVVVNGEKAWTLDEDGIGGFAIVAGEIGKGTVNTGGKLIVDPDGKAGYVTVNTGGGDCLSMLAERPVKSSSMATRRGI